MDVDDLGVGSIESEVSELREAVEDLEWLEGETDDLDSRLWDLESAVGDLCNELDIYC